MARVTIARHLRRYRDVPNGMQVEGHTVAEVLHHLERAYPGLSDYVVDERGALRQHVNIFIGDCPVRDRTGLSDEVEHHTELYILQALSGG